MRRLVVLPLLLLCVVATGCHTTGDRSQNRYVSEPRLVYCTVMADAPRRDAEPPRAIVGVVRFRCDEGGPDTLTLAMRLEKQNGAQWSAVRRRTVTFRGAETVAGIFKYQQTEVSAACDAGRFRTVVDWARTSRGVSTPDRSRGPTTKDPCAPRIF